LKTSSNDDVTATEVVAGRYELLFLNVSQQVSPVHSADLPDTSMWSATQLQPSGL
jgi:hypothetical protein